MTGPHRRSLLPLREKVSAKLTDEGSTAPIRLISRNKIPCGGATPHPTGSARHLLPQGEKGL
jgi:hypothetical protein